MDSEGEILLEVIQLPVLASTEEKYLLNVLAITLVSVISILSLTILFGILWVLSILGLKISLIIHASRFWPIWVTESAVSGIKGLQKSWRNNNWVRVRALAVMDIGISCASRVPPPPPGEVPGRCEDQSKGKDPHCYGPFSPLPVCASPWVKCGRVDTTFRPIVFYFIF